MMKLDKEGETSYLLRNMQILLLLQDFYKEDY